MSYIAICPECNLKVIYEGNAIRPRLTCTRCKTRFYFKTQETPKKKIIEKITKSNNKPPTNPPQFIDDPDELLMSVAVRELNKSNPDPRWASILINCRKENISIKSEVIDQLQKLPTKALTEMLRKQSGKSSQVE